VALILNEVLQNAVEHGFGEGSDDGNIAIVLAEEPHQIRLQVSNDGTPLPENFDFKKADSLGLQIVDSLVRGDLHGKFTLTQEGDRTFANVVFDK
jgi:two-component sensor histidine kinase